MAFRPPDDLSPLLRGLPRDLYSHTARVVAEVDRIAAGDPEYERLTRAAWAHDVARALDEAELLRRAEEYGLEILPEERASPILLHGPVGAEILARELGWSDAEILDAVRYHTTGRPEMTRFEAMVLLADKVEPAKVTDEDMRRVRGLAGEDPWAALRAFYDWHEANNAKLGRVTHRRAAAARAWASTSRNL